MNHHAICKCDDCSSVRSSWGDLSCSSFNSLEYRGLMASEPGRGGQVDTGGLDLFREERGAPPPLGCGPLYLMSGKLKKSEFRRVVAAKNARVACARHVRDLKRKKGVSDPTTLAPRMITSLTNESTQNPFEFLPSGEDSDRCRFETKYGKQAPVIERFLSKELDIKPVVDGPFPAIQCLGLRDAVRDRFPAALSEVAELSFRTVAKVTRSVCVTCKEKYADKLREWREERFKDQPVDDDHLDRFKRTFRSNLPEKWNETKYPYIPNGHATLSHRRCEGGNWNEDQFADHCKPELVISSGKPRIVTLFSEFNTRVLTPLHYSLYGRLRKRGWLLVGDPTATEIEMLEGQDYVSFDFKAATDNIKTAYVRAAVDILIEQGQGLSDDEIRCLRVLGELRLEPGGEIATRGQPMGSVMSFPLLCLINKTCVDLSLEDLLVKDCITFKEWSGHRVRINGDDLLTRELRRGSSFRDAISVNGAEIGFVINREKTMVSPSKGEINSTLFEDGVLQKKVNAGALFMAPDVNDVLGLAAEASLTTVGFRRLVRANCHILAKQDVKMPTRIPDRLRRVCLGDAKIRSALSSEPLLHREPPRNFFTVAPRPQDYVLTRDEEVRIVNERVVKVRPWAVAFSGKPVRFRTGIIKDVRRPASQLRYRKVTVEEDTILSVLATANQLKLKESLREREEPWIQTDMLIPEIISDADSKIGRIIDVIKEWKRSRGPQTRHDSFGCLGDQISLDCGG